MLHFSVGLVPARTTPAPAFSQPTGTEGLVCAEAAGVRREYIKAEAAVTATDKVVFIGGIGGMLVRPCRSMNHLPGEASGSCRKAPRGDGDFPEGRQRALEPAGRNDYPPTLKKSEAAFST
jgi:hypothetical protein